MTHPQDPGDPSTRWFDRVGMVLMAPSASADALGGYEEMDAFRDRLIAVEDFGELERADQELVLRCEVEVNNDLSPLAQGHTGGDWAAEDAAEDADDLPVAQVKADDDVDWVGL